MKIERKKLLEELCVVLKDEFVAEVTSHEKGVVNAFSIPSFTLYKKCAIMPIRTFERRSKWQSAL